jgi:hypothetical protein
VSTHAHAETVPDATTSVGLAPALLGGLERTAINDVTNGHGEKTVLNNVNVPMVPNATTSLEDVFAVLDSLDKDVIEYARMVTLAQTA